MIYFILGLLNGMLLLALILYFALKKKMSKFNKFFEVDFNGLDFERGEEDE